MDVDTALRTRGSTRAFLPTPLTRATVEAILDVARYAPSGSNIQPWSVYAIAGAPRHALSAEVRHAATHARAEHVSEYNYYPVEWRDPYLARRRACGWGLYSLLGITKGDRERGLAQELRNFDFFNAPVGLFFYIDRDLGHGSWLDYGMFLQSVMLAAEGHGLATCAQAAWAPFHRIVSKAVGAPESQMLICGLALGHRDPAAPVNKYRPERLAPDGFTQWQGFEEGA